MFKNQIIETPYTTAVADEFFSNIRGDKFCSDNSFLSTLRALVYPRMGASDRLSLYFSFSAVDEAKRSSLDHLVSLTSFCAVNGARGVFQIHSLNSSNHDGCVKYLEFAERYFESEYPDYHEIPKVREFFRKSFAVLCLANEELESTILFVENLDYKKLHYIQCGILAMLPWYFNPADGISEDEMALIKSCRERTSAKFEEATAKLASQYDFREMKIRQELSGFESRYLDSTIREVERKLGSINDSIKRYFNEIKNLMAQKEQEDIYLTGLRNKKYSSNEEEDSEIMQYFLSNKNLSLDNVQGSNITFVAGGYLTYFDEDMAERLIENDRSYIYMDGHDYYDGLITSEGMRKLMTAIFLDQELKIKFKAAYRLTISGNPEVRAISRYTYGSIFPGYLPNPHTDMYSCMGTYEKETYERLLEHDYIGAIEQCVVSARSLNFADSVVMQGFMRIMYGNVDQISFIELPDGSMVTPVEAIEYLNKKEEE